MRMTPILPALIAALAAAQAQPAAASPATTVLPMYFSAIVRNSELIAVGTAQSFSSRREDGGRMIRTYVTFGDLSVHKGAVAGPTLTLRLGGGTIDGETIAVAGLPRFQQGKRYLLFVRRDAAADSPIVGFHQGCFEVVASGGREILATADGLQVIKIQDDRLVLAARPHAARPPKPEPQLDERQLEILRRAQADAARRTTAAAATRDPSPILVAPELDSGERLSLAEMLQHAEHAGEKR